ncbi:MAG: type III pantothenate kinase [Armatimonadetes bacterium]|nr:type III pantothenate kinase [Armatimonadota bacterium]
MLLAIDVGNSHSVFGIWDGTRWIATWRHQTDVETTEDELAAWLFEMMRVAGVTQNPTKVACASVVPGMNRNLSLMASKFFGVEVEFLTGSSNHGVAVDYNPPTAVGADRIANAIGALARYSAPIIVVDFGTATTFDVIDANGVYAGGAIMAGPMTSMQALANKTAKLPAIDLVAPETAIGKHTTHSIQSGVMFGYAGAIDAIVRKIEGELGARPKVIATGGLGEVFTQMCETIESYDAMLTLDGIRLYAEKAI